MFWKQIKLVPVALTVAIICAASALLHHGKTEGSALGGYVQNGHYFLSLGHGLYQETDARHFQALLRDERIVGGSLLVLVLAIIWIAIRMKGNGLPVEAKDIVHNPRVIHPDFEQL